MTESVLQLFNPSGIALPVQESKLRKILSDIEENEKISFALLEIVFVDEKEIVRINRDHLGRDYVTDIISFRYDEEDQNQEIEGTLFCCAPRILEQAPEFGTTPEEEFHRIVIHGLLHLAGYEDQTPESKKKMTEMEERYLSRL